MARLAMAQYLRGRLEASAKARATIKSFKDAEPDPMIPLLAKLGVAESRLTAIYDRTMKQLELSKIFLSLLEPSAPAPPPAPASPPPPSPASPR